MFECDDGTLVNASLVTYCEITVSGNIFIVKFHFNNDSCLRFNYQCNKDAKSLLNKFKNHCSVHLN